MVLVSILLREALSNQFSVVSRLEISMKGASIWYVRK